MKLIFTAVLFLGIASSNAGTYDKRGWFGCRGGSFNYGETNYGDHQSEQPPDLPGFDDDPFGPPSHNHQRDQQPMNYQTGNQHPMHQQAPPLPPGFDNPTGQGPPLRQNYDEPNLNFQEPDIDDGPEMMESWGDGLNDNNDLDLGVFDKDYILKGLAKLYRKKILPLELSSRYGHFHSAPLSPSDFVAPPMVLLLGPFRYAI